MNCGHCSARTTSSGMSATGGINHTSSRRNLFTVEGERCPRFPRVARCSQPWALLLNPFGIPARLPALRSVQGAARTGALSAPFRSRSTIASKGLAVSAGDDYQWWRRKHVRMAKLVFDIESSALPLDQLDEAQQEYLFRDCAKLSDEPARAAKRTEIEQQRSLWPLTAQV